MRDDTHFADLCLAVHFLFGHRGIATRCRRLKALKFPHQRPSVFCSLLFLAYLQVLVANHSYYPSKHSWLFPRRYCLTRVSLASSLWAVQSP